MDIIFIRKLSVRTIIGVYSWERKCLQQLIFDLDVGYNRSRLTDCDCIQDCLNYQDVSNFVNILISKSRFFLLESVAESVARGIILQFNVPWIRVKVSKFGAIAKDVDVGVIIERTQKDVL